jgi:hypothetical protein
MLDASTITVSAFAHASRKRRVRRAIISLIVFLLLLTVGTGATYSAFTNPPERTGIKHEALLPPPTPSSPRARPFRPGERRPSVPRTSC